jgi:pimeloyl-ACP methyl ester carboxylesterase
MTAARKGCTFCLMARISRRRLAARATARARSLVLLSIVMDLPLLGRTATGLTRRPRVENLEVDGIPVEVTCPAGRGPWPAFVFVTGAHPLRRKEPVVQRVALGLARAGYVAVVPDLPGLGSGELTVRTLEAAAAVIEAAAARHDVRDRRVALVGASTGASIALISAARPELARHVSLVAAVAPFADIERIVCLATTRRYEEEDGALVEYAVTALLRRAVARSLVACLPDPGDRELLLARLGSIEEETDALEALDIDAETLRPETRAVVRLLTNRDPGRFRDLYGELAPDLLMTLRELSPLTRATSLTVPVELAVPPQDPYFPFREASALVASLPNVRLTVTSTLDHTRPTASLRGLRDLARFDRFVVRTLATAA